MDIVKKIVGPRKWLAETSDAKLLESIAVKWQNMAFW